MTTETGWSSASAELLRLFGDAPVELRFSLSGRAAIRVLAPCGPVSVRHAEPPAPVAPWSVTARCGDAIGWLLAHRTPVRPQAAQALLQRVVERQTARALQHRGAVCAAMATDLLEGLTHALRTDVSALETVAQGALIGALDPDALSTAPGELRRVGESAQRRLAGAREVMATLRPGAERHPEPLVSSLQDELLIAGADVAVASPAGERPMALIPGVGWSACARLLAGALAGDERFDPAEAITVSPDVDGWMVVAGSRGPAVRRLAWREQTVGEMVHAGRTVVAAGGTASAVEVDGGRLRVMLTIPAAPST